MDTARLFQSGRSQAVRLPKEYRFSCSEVVVKHFGNGVLLLPIDDPWQTLVLFNDACGSTLALRAEELRERLPPLEAELLAGHAMCTRHCLSFGDLEPCLNPCRNAPLRNYVGRMVAARVPRDDQSPAPPAPLLDSLPAASSLG